jgi:hypothetical protein
MSTRKLIGYILYNQQENTFLTSSFCVDKPEGPAIENETWKYIPCYEQSDVGYSVHVIVTADPSARNES